MAQTSSGRALGVMTSTPTLDGLSIAGTTAVPAVVDLGGASTDKVGFYGVTAIVQGTAIASVVSGTAATTATFGTPTPDITALITAVNAIQAALKAVGITK